MKVLTFCDQNLENTLLFQSCVEYGITVINLYHGEKWSTNSIKLRHLNEYLNTADLEEIYLVVDAFDVIISSNESEILKTFLQFNSEILFSAEANFYFRHENLNYYYWKFYPRQSTHFEYLNSGSFIGKGLHIRRMIQHISELYEIDLNNYEQLEKLRSDQYIFSRYYVDLHYARKNDQKVQISLDHQQKLLGCSGGRMLAYQVFTKSKLLSYLRFKIERQWLKSFSLSTFQLLSSDYQFENEKFTTKTLQNAPSVLHIPGSRGYFGKQLSIIQNQRLVFKEPKWYLAVLVSTFSLVQLFLWVLLISIFNRKFFRYEDIFRDKKHTNQDFSNASEIILEYLEKKTPFSFSHFNDGELDFIKRFLNEDDKQVWFGRKQNLYSEELGEKLYAAFSTIKQNSLIGIPCSICHPAEYSLASKLKKGSANCVPAMTIHHNLSVLPTLFQILRSRKVHFICNVLHDLTLFRLLGIKFTDKQVTRVPTKNAFSEFDQLELLKFPADTVVLMMCGMVGKALIPTLSTNNPSCSFLTLGSSLDDFIQNDNMRFRLFPSKLPLTRNIRNSRSFLFGKKNKCPECYNFTS
ncbi:MAG: glycosyltransferase domain-containing protein [Cyclobacteriaceae bacterium]